MSAGRTLKAAVIQHDLLCSAYLSYVRLTVVIWRGCQFMKMAGGMPCCILNRKKEEKLNENTDLPSEMFYL